MGLFTPARCQLCTTPLRRRYYTWTTPQGTASVCPKCNTRLENMKSRAVFDPSKPFVFPPIRKSSPQVSGCGCLGIGCFVAFIVIGVSGNLSHQPTAPPAPFISKPQHTIIPSEPAPAPTSAPAPEPAATSPSAPPTVDLSSNSHFPATIVLKQRLDVRTDSGGFGLSPGDSVVILRRDGDDYVIERQGKDYRVNADQLDNLQNR
jgi:hypothetical protein